MLIHKGDTGIPWVPKGPLRISDCKKKKRISDNVVLLAPGGKTTQQDTRQHKPMDWGGRISYLVNFYLQKGRFLPPINPGSEESKEMQSRSSFQASKQGSKGIFMNLRCTSVPIGQNTSIFKKTCDTIVSYSLLKNYSWVRKTIKKSKKRKKNCCCALYKSQGENGAKKTSQEPF